jgi:hypothetical protein
MSNVSGTRVIVYVDGFNLYFGLRDARLRRCYWLDVQALARRLLKPGQELRATKYFTARIRGAAPGDPADRRRWLEAKRRRQAVYLEALGTLPDFGIFEGHFLAKPMACKNCGHSWETHEEKMTDVCIATEMLTDAFQDRFDAALLISGDSDLVPPIQAVCSMFPGKRVVVAFPPKRFSADLAHHARGRVKIWPRLLGRCQFPDQVRKPDGTILRRPESWR